jgi:hypothetical protein
MSFEERHDFDLIMWQYGFAIDELVVKECEKILAEECHVEKEEGGVRERTTIERT